MSLTTKDTHWGSLGQAEVRKFELASSSGFRVQISNYGASLISVLAPDRNGRFEEVCLSHEKFDDFVQNSAYLGATVGRFANRLEGGAFKLDDKQYKLAQNNGSNCLHGGLSGFDKKIWAYEMMPCGREHPDRAGVRFTYISEDGEEGFPGELHTSVTYSIGLNCDLQIAYESCCPSGKRSITNLTNHSYWNLSGNFRESIRDHSMELNCPYYLPLGENQIPTGSLDSCKGSPFDFSSKLVRLGPRIDLVDGGGRPGIDHCFAMVEADHKKESTVLRLMACLQHEHSGRTMKLYGTQTALQVYTNNWADGKPGPHAAHFSVALEAMSAFPNALNVDAWKWQAILEPGTVYTHSNAFVFSVHEPFLPS
jgi:aldose 1-epimerase